MTRSGGTLNDPEELRYVRLPNDCVWGAATLKTSADAQFTGAGTWCPIPGTGRVDPDTGETVRDWQQITSDGSFGPTVIGRTVEGVATALAGSAPTGLAGYFAAREKRRGLEDQDGGDFNFNPFINNASQSDASAASDLFSKQVQEGWSGQ